MFGSVPETFICFSFSIFESLVCAWTGNEAIQTSDAMPTRVLKLDLRILFLLSIDPADSPSPKSSGRLRAVSAWHAAGPIMTALGWHAFNVFAAGGRPLQFRAGGAGRRTAYAGCTPSGSPACDLAPTR